MLRPLSRIGFTFCALLALFAVPAAAQPPSDDLEGILEKAMKSAVMRVAPSVVQIETTGGSDVVGSGPGGQQVRRGTGPTTGLVVAADGYIISSAFNFANKPSAIFVSVPGKAERLVAKLVATDQTRMLTLLKVEAKGLPVPTVAAKSDIRVGQWSFALGRTWSGLDTQPSVSIGIISALGRIWGKAIQTDAKVSPVNYGGPLVDIQGRVLGILVPASPRGQDEAAGVEWYDSGIGFAIPLEDINRVLPRLRQGQELKRGLLGITLQSTDIYGVSPVIASISPESAAARAGIKPGDAVIEINGSPIVRQAQILHSLGEKYEGDVVSVKVRRGKEEISFSNLKLSGTLTAFTHPLLGILPLRDDPELGEEIRYVFPKSPAEKAGLKPGDRITKLGFGEAPMQPFSGREDLTAVFDLLPPGSEIRLEIERKEGKKKETVKVTLGTMTEEIPDVLPARSSLKKAREQRKLADQQNFRLPGQEIPGLPPMPRPNRPPRPQEKKDEKKVEKKDEKKEEKKAETGFLKRATAAGEHDYWLFVPVDYDPNVAHALVVWLHPSGRNKDKETENMIAAWEDHCSENHIILLCPKAENESGWLGSEADFILQTTRDVMGEYTIDRRRVITHGMGVGGQMAYYLGFNARDLIRGVAPVGAAQTGTIKDNVANQRLSFFIAAGSNDPFIEPIRESKTKLGEHKFPVVYKELAGVGQQYIDSQTLQEVVRWLDSLDRQ